MKKVILIVVVTVIAVIFLPDLLMGQPPPPPPKDINQVPIDGGLALLAAAGGAYGLKKLKGKKE